MLGNQDKFCSLINDLTSSSKPTLAFHDLANILFVPVACEFEFELKEKAPFIILSAPQPMEIAVSKVVTHSKQFNQRCTLSMPLLSLVFFLYQVVRRMQKTPDF